MINSIITLISLAVAGFVFYKLKLKEPNIIRRYLKAFIVFFGGFISAYILMMALYIGGLLLFANIFTEDTSEPFSRSAWLEQPEQRIHMLHDLMYNNQLQNGMSKAEVEDLLGEPTNKTDNNEWHYDLNLSDLNQQDLDLNTDMGQMSFTRLILTFEQDHLIHFQQIELEN